MKAYRLFGSHDARLLDVHEPSPQAGEVLVRVAGAGVCGSDVHALEAADRYGYPLPYTLGHEVVGWVETCGDGVTGRTAGEAVAVYPLLLCGRCPSCARGDGNLCRTRFPVSLGAGTDGGMAELVVAPAENLVPIGDLDPIAATPLTDAGMTSYNAIKTVRDRLTEGARCVVIGVGGLGHVALQILRATTPATVIAVDVDPARLAFAQELGAAATVVSDDAAASRIAELCDGIGADVVLDFVGAKATAALAVASIAAGGKIAMVGLADGAIEVRLGALLPPQVEVVVPLAGGRKDLEAVVALAREGSVVAKTVTYPLEQAEQVLGLLRDGRIDGRAVLTPS